jgi:1,5-anhydro-D-fructose reductase (1,5-anhydro-D-mannitol-forming)
MAELGWGVVGIGRFLTGTIAPAIVAEPSSRLVAGVSRSEERASLFAAEFGVPYSYDDYGAMLANPEVDVVYIATPNALHSGQVIAAADAGKHIFCDKPLAIDSSGAQAAVNACHRAGVSLGINFHNRYLPWVQDVAGMVTGGSIGEVQVVEVDVGSGPRRYTNWRADPALAGLGTVHNVGVHALDFLRLILDAEPVEVVALFDTAPIADAVEMLALILVRFDNGALVYCNCNEKVTHPTNTIVIHGSAGRITGAGFTRSRDDGYLTVLNGNGETTTHYPAPEAHRLAVASFARAVLEGREPSPSGFDGLRSAQLCEAIRRSVVERRVVTVPSAPDESR